MQSMTDVCMGRNLKTWTFPNPQENLQSVSVWSKNYKFVPNQARTKTILVRPRTKVKTSSRAWPIEKKILTRNGPIEHFKVRPDSPVQKKLKSWPKLSVAQMNFYKNTDHYIYFVKILSSMRITRNFYLKSTRNPIRQHENHFR